MSKDQIIIGFVGGGNMAQALVQGLLQAGHQPGRLAVADPSEAQRARLGSLSTEIQIVADNAAVAGADVLVLAVKPQIMDVVLKQLRTLTLPRGQLILSVAAGIRLAMIQAALGADTAAVRAMPNQPALAGAGMTVMAASPQVTPEQRSWAHYVASSVGEAAWIEEEALMDAVTAVSGSGPAYFYLIAELMEGCAREMGIEPGLARLLVRQTAWGAAQVIRSFEADVQTLRSRVTSPGGTTAAAVEILEQQDIRGIFRRALAAARDRSVELGNAIAKPEQD